MAWYQLLNDNITLVVALVFLLLGYWMGRNSAERPLRAKQEPKESPAEDPTTLHDRDGGYFDDDVLRLEDEEGFTARIPTV